MTLPAQKEDIQLVKTVCSACFNCCGIVVKKVNGIVVKIEGDQDNPHNKGRMCAKGQAGIMALYDPNRVLRPLKRTNPEKGITVDPKWQEITWEEALSTIAEKLAKVRADDPRKLSVYEEDFNTRAPAWINAFQSAFGTANALGQIGGAYCGNVHPTAFLTQAGFYLDPDLEYCNYCLYFGTQTGFMVHSNAVGMAQAMSDARVRGMKLVVVDPVCVPAASKADEWVPIRPGTDGAMALSMANVLINDLKIYDAEFLRKYTNGPYLTRPDGKYLRDAESNKPLVWDTAAGGPRPFDTVDSKALAITGEFEVDGQKVRPAFEALRQHLKVYDPDRIAGITTVSADTIRRLAREFGEAAQIGSTIVIDGYELPFRPACVHFGKGPGAHLHGLVQDLSIQLLNLIVGAVDVPGGILSVNANNPFFGPKEDKDGLITPGLLVGLLPYPGREPRKPDSVHLLEFMPVAYFADATLIPNSMEKKFDVPQTEVLLHCRTNPMVSTGSPKGVEAWLKSIPFQFSIARELNETAEFADIVLPDCHYLEELFPLTNTPLEWVEAGYGHWYQMTRQPVVDAPEGIKSNWMEILIDLAKRIGILEDFNLMVDLLLNLKEDLKLDLSKRYSWAEISDRHCQNTYGPEHNLDWFKEHGVYKIKKKIEWAYERVFIKGRAPIYYEHFLHLGEQLTTAAKEFGVEWDVSDYQALLEWRPCASYEGHPPEFDLFAVNYKLAYHTFTHSLQNPWLAELGEYVDAYKIMVNAQTAARKGIGDGDLIRVESSHGLSVEGTARVTQRIHPEAIGIAGAFGQWARRKTIARGRGVHFNSLINWGWRELGTLGGELEGCARVKISKVCGKETS